MNIKELLEYHESTGKETAVYTSDNGMCQVGIVDYNKYALAGDMKNANFTIINE